LNPDTHLIGVELAANMIEKAHELIRTSNTQNVTIVQGDITSLTFGDRSADGIISTMTLHHLPQLQDLRACFRELQRVLRPQGALYLADFGRLKLLDSIRFFAHMHEASLPPEVVQDYELSLRAAFSVDEYRRLAGEELEPRPDIYQTFLAPFMVIIKSPDRPVDSRIRSNVRGRLDKISPSFRRDLDDLRRFFRLGGLRGDPF
jgi:arsenite methyltransferase